MKIIHLVKQDRQVPYAVMNYRKLVEEGHFFVDHTRFLRELERRYRRLRGRSGRLDDIVKPTNQ